MRDTITFQHYRHCRIIVPRASWNLEEPQFTERGPSLRTLKLAWHHFRFTCGSFERSLKYTSLFLLVTCMRCLNFVNLPISRADRMHILSWVRWRMEHMTLSYTITKDWPFQRSSDASLFYNFYYPTLSGKISDCYLFHVPKLPSQLASNVRGGVIEKNWLELHRRWS